MATNRPSTISSADPTEQISRPITVEELSKSMQSFGAIDYSVFFGMLLCCSLIGIYFGIQNRKKTHVERRGSAEQDYLMGGRQMKTFPVAMSQVASWLSGITLLGLSTEIYVYGTEFMLLFVTIFFSGLAGHYVFLPVFVEMKLTSIYGYLEARYDRRMRVFGSFLFIFGAILWAPICVYVPALAFNQVTGINVHIISPVVCLICVFYTCIGGIKAVIWTDVIQTVIMYGTIGLIIYKGTTDIGGLSVLYQRNFETDRISFPPMTLDPTVRNSVLSILIGGGLFWLQSNSTNQGTIQRYLTLPNLRKTRQTLWIFVFGVTLLMSMCCYNGLLIFAKYYDCDPLTTKLAKAKDQLVPLLVMDIFRDLPGMIGLFVAGIFSAALSSLSTTLNSLVAVLLEDFIKPCMKTPLSKTATNYLMKGVVLICGLICMTLVIIVERLGAVLQLSISLSGITNGPLFAIFIMGLTIPWIKAKSAFCGGITGLIVIAYTSFKAQAAIASGEIYLAVKPTTIDGCTYDFDRSYLNVTRPPPMYEDGDWKPFYHMSYLWYIFFSTVVTIAVSFAASFVFGFQKSEDIDPMVIAPFLRKYFCATKESIALRNTARNRQIVIGIE